MYKTFLFFVFYLQALSVIIFEAGAKYHYAVTGLDLKCAILNSLMQLQPVVGFKLF